MSDSDLDPRFDDLRDDERHHGQEGDSFESDIDLYLTGDLPERRRPGFRDEMLSDRARYEKVRRARECHGILDDYCDHLRSRAGHDGTLEEVFGALAATDDPREKARAIVGDGVQPS